MAPWGQSATRTQPDAVRPSSLKAVRVDHHCCTDNPKRSNASPAIAANVSNANTPAGLGLRSLKMVKNIMNDASHTNMPVAATPNS